MKQKIHNELNEALKYNLSFAGCGFLGIYHGETLRPAITSDLCLQFDSSFSSITVGVAVAFKKYAPQLLLQKISGASAGALAATCLLTDMPLGECNNNARKIFLSALKSEFPRSGIEIENALKSGAKHARDCSRN